jgi:hypothetical protein
MNDVRSKVILGIDVNEFRKGIQKVDSSIKGISRQFQNLGGVIGATFAFSKIQEFVTESIKLNGQLQKAAAGFARFGTETDLQQLRKQTRGLVSDLEIMQQTVKGANLGIPFRDMGVLLEFAKRRADETGESIENLIGSIIEGVGRKSTRRLDNLGISADRLKEKIGGMSLEMSSVADVSRAMVEIANEELGKMGTPIDTANDKLQRLTTTWENLMAVVGGPLAGMAANLLEGITPGAMGASMRGAGKMAGTGGQFPSSQDITSIRNQGIFNAFPSTGNADTTETLAGLRESLKALREQYDAAAIGSVRFHELSAMIYSAESRVKELTGSFKELNDEIAKGIKVKGGITLADVEPGLLPKEAAITPLYQTNMAIFGIRRQTEYAAGSWEHYTESIVNAARASNDWLTASQKNEEQLAAMAVVGQEFGNILKASFEASIINGESFFETFKKGFKSYIQQMLAMAAATTALAVALAFVTGGANFQAAFNQIGGGMGLPFGFDEDNKLSLKLSGTDFYGGFKRNETRVSRSGG